MCYAYAEVSPLKDVTATVGLSFDSLSGDQNVGKKIARDHPSRGGV
jgi:hypothetical protein